MRRHPETAIKFLEREAAEWRATAVRELSEESTRDIGKIRLVLIEECLKVLRLMRQKVQ